MSDSRLEKFIYAICSMDVTDLPVPLSRIEKLWNCLITGETPDFEPLSRNEKYLMAMLNRYDISNLPAPMSRSEKLLYKIAVGETDLSDVPGYLSRYEELLKYLIENGGIGDFEYVLYTLNQSLSTLYTTAEKPVKSAILKGQTLVNLLDTEMLKDDNNINAIMGVALDKDYFISDHTDGQFQISKDNKSPLEGKLMEGKTYTLVMTVNTTDKTSDGVDVYIGLDSTTHTTGTKFLDNANGVVKIKFTPSVKETPSTGSRLQIGFYNRAVVKISRKIMLLEGDYTNVDIPYFEGMQSVKMPVLTTVGRNLWNPHLIKKYTESTKNDFNLDSYSTLKKPIIKLKPNTTYKVVFTTNEGSGVERNILFGFKLTDKPMGGINEESARVTISKNAPTYTETLITTDNTGNLYLFVLDYSSDGGYVHDAKIAIPKVDIHIEESKTYISTEPYKSNILTVNEEVELGSVGEVKDELNLLTGQLTQRTETRAYQEGDESNSEVLTDMTNTRYKLPKEAIKTVDLTVVDQDNKPTKLGTFENVTHVSLESAGLIPEVEMEVATHISEELASASPLMDDISTKQEQLEATVNEQSNNVDATMIATTEIYEGTL